MKKVIYALILLLVVISGLVFANREIKHEPSKKPIPKPLTAAEREAGRKQWETTTPEGKKFKQWEASPEGQKVLDGIANIRKPVNTLSNMEAVVIALSLPPGSRLGYGMMVRINGAEYILSFGLEQFNEFQQLRSLQVTDMIIIRSHNVSYAPKYAYPIIAGDYVERDSKIIYKRAPRKGGC